MCSFCARGAACRLSRLSRLGGTLRQGVWLFGLFSTVRGATDIVSANSRSVRNLSSEPLVQKTTPVSNTSSTTRRGSHAVSRNLRTPTKGLSGPAAPAGRPRVAGSPGHPSRRTARARSPAAGCHRPKLRPLCAHEGRTARDRSPARMLALGTRCRRREGTRYDASLTRTSPLSAARAGARSRPRGRPERRPGRPGCPRARRCDLRPRA